MFEVPTVLILGAGASWHYGYPLGEGLVDDIIENTAGERYERTPSRRLAQALQFHDPLSIDAFLNFRRNETQLVEAGKLEITKSLLRAEQKEFFTRNYSTYNRETGKNEIRGNWYKFIASAITANLENYSDLIEKPFNLDIITFNYDLSLEYFFYSRFNTIPTFTREQHQKFFEILNNSIFHFYGQIGKFRWQGDPNGRENNEYGHYNEKIVSNPNINSDWALEEYALNFSDQIKLIGERKDDRAIIHEKLKRAKRIYFLGFGFDRDNVAQMELGRTCLHAHEIYYTNFNDSDFINRFAVNKLFNSYSFFDNNGTMSQSGGRNKGEHLMKSTKNVYDALKFDFSLTG